LIIFISPKLIIGNSLWDFLKAENNNNLVIMLGESYENRDLLLIIEIVIWIVICLLSIVLFKIKSIAYLCARRVVNVETVCACVSLEIRTSWFVTPSSIQNGCIQQKKLLTKQLIESKKGIDLWLICLFIIIHRITCLL